MASKGGSKPNQSTSSVNKTLPNVKKAANSSQNAGRTSNAARKDSGTATKSKTISNSGGTKLPAINSKKVERKQQITTPNSADKETTPVENEISTQLTQNNQHSDAAGKVTNSGKTDTNVVCNEANSSIETGVISDSTASESTTKPAEIPVEPDGVGSIDQITKANASISGVPNANESAPAVVEVIENNGKVKLIYERYDEEFAIVNGTTTQENIDEEYCLSFVMPDCHIHLSKHEPAVKRELEANGELNELYIHEDPPGTYHGLRNNEVYYVYVEQEALQFARDQERMKHVAASMEGAVQKDENGDIIKPDDGRGMESCSCIYGNPCVDEYGCKDWTNRYAVAKKNGWKGF